VKFFFFLNYVCLTDKQDFRKIRNSVRKNAIVFICFDVTNPQSFRSVSVRWFTPVEACRGLYEFHGPVMVVGTKIDLMDERKVSLEEERDLAESRNPPCSYFEVSAKTGEGVTECFEKAVKLFNRYKKEPRSEPAPALQPSSKPSKSKQCIIC